MNPGERWRAAATRVGVPPDLAAQAAADLERRYSEPHRRYHDTTHVDAVLREAVALAEGCAADEIAVLELAACAHDVVYDARSGDDERASAAWARDQLEEANGGVAERVSDLVLTTIAHRPNDDPLAAALLDADLAILGADAMVYDRYTAAVRAEYCAVPDDAWVSGRAEVLTRLLARDRLFLTESAHRRLDDQARNNLARELERLRR